MEPVNVGKDGMEPDILYDEFEKALSELNDWKANGIDGISAKIIKALGHTGSMSCLSTRTFTERVTGQEILRNLLSFQ